MIINTAEIQMYLSDIRAIKRSNMEDVYELTYQNHDRMLTTKMVAEEKKDIMNEIVIEVQCI